MKLWVVFWLGMCSVLGAQTDPLWEQALSEWDQGRPEAAAEAFARWDHESSGQGRRTPALDHNLAVAKGRLQDWEAATYHLARSAFSRANPLYQINALALLARVQHRLLIQNALPQQTAFRFACLASSRWILLLGVAAFWLAAFALLFPHSRKRGLQVAVFLGVLAGALAGLKAALPQYAVLSGPQPGVPLSAEPTTQATPLAALPSGTLVALGSSQGDFTSVTAPFVGWVPKQNIRVVD